MDSIVKELPQWDMQVVYAGLDSGEFEADFQAMVAAVADLVQLFDEREIDRTERAGVDTAVVMTFEEAVRGFNRLAEEMATLRAYIYSFVVTNSRDELAQAKLSELQTQDAKLSLLHTRLIAWLGSLDVDALLAASPLARDHVFMLRRSQKAAVYLMSPVEESLAVDLSLTGKQSWYKMFRTFTSQLSTEMELDGDEQTFSLPALQNLVYHPDRQVRHRAYEAAQVMLEGAAVPIAAALNSIKGEVLTLAQRRGWHSPLEAALFENAIDREILDVMMAAARTAFPDLQRYLTIRARALGLPVLRWYDRFVALGEGSQSWSYAEASQFVTTQFATYSPKLQQLAQRAFGENWIDVAPRDGKSGGAFCMWLRAGESRILANFEPSFADVGMLAHELGHAFHNLNQAQCTVLQRATPMVLSETASTFCQKIVENAALKTADASDQLIILDGLLEYATRVVIGVSGDFLFEERLFEKRQQRDLSVEELCEIMSAVQQETLGQAVDPDYLYPYRWVYVPHYYARNYYNFPYIFGLLFGLGLYAQYQVHPDSFQDRYDHLLASTGMAEVADLAQQFGIDIRSSDFWQASLDVLRADVDQFERLVRAKTEGIDA